MNHIFLGSMIPFLVSAVIYFKRQHRASIPMLIITPLTMLLFSIWAVAPDIPRLLGMSDLYYRLSTDPRCNVFFWHYSIDMVETDSNIWAAGVLGLCVLLMWTAWRELSISERQK
mgnify:CR=1 FL=1